MITGRIRIRVPGIFAPSESETPSLGCSVSTSTLGCTPGAPSSWANAMCGACLKVIVISVTLRARRLPVRR